LCIAVTIHTMYDQPIVYII